MSLDAAPPEHSGVFVHLVRGFRTLRGGVGVGGRVAAGVGPWVHLLWWLVFVVTCSGSCKVMSCSVLSLCPRSRGVGKGWPLCVGRVSTAIGWSPWAVVGFSRVWPGGFPGGGHGFPRRCSGGSVEGLDSFAGGGLSEADRVAAGHDDVGVVEEPVDERGGDGAGHEFFESGWVQI